MIERIKDILKKVKNNQIEIDKAVEELKFLPFLDLKSVKIDFHRSLRKIGGEVIFCQKKSPEEILKILDNSISYIDRILLTKVKYWKFLKIKDKIPYENIIYNKEGEILIVEKEKTNFKLKGYILILTAGTSDIKIAEEAKTTANFLGSYVKTIYDIGSSGFHRILEYKDEIQKAKVLIVIAGMDGVLPTLIAGLFEKPIIAVPSSCGYGVAKGGISALLSMLSSCAPGIAVVNIDNGFGAAYFAHLINCVEE